MVHFCVAGYRVENRFRGSGSEAFAEHSLMVVGDDDDCHSYTASSYCIGF